MQDLIRNTTCDNLVNYSSPSTSIVNGIETAPTESPDSLSFLMKNNVLISFSLSPNQNIDNNSEKKPEATLSK